MRTPHRGSPIGHERARELAATRLDFDLDPVERDALDDHLASCVTCRRFAFYLRSDDDALRNLPQVDAPPRVAAVVAGKVSPRRRIRTSPLLLAATVSLLGLAAIAGLTGAGVGRPSPTTRPSDQLAASPLTASPAVPVASIAPPTASVPPSFAPLVWQRSAGSAAFGARTGIIEAVSTGPAGLVAVGDGCHKGDDPCHAAVWHSADGSTWIRVADTPALAVGANVSTRRGEMTDVIAGGPGYVAVGREPGESGRRAVIWTSVDGQTWARVPNSSIFNGGTIEAVIAAGPGLVAVGNDIDGSSAVAAVWTSLDGLSWQRTATQPGFELGGQGTFNDGRLHGSMVDVTTGGPGIVAVGSVCSTSGGHCRAAVWTSPDAVTWTRVADGPVFDGSMYGVTSLAGRLVAVGDDGSGRRPRAWTSADGRSWSAVDPAGTAIGAFTTVQAAGDRIVAATVSTDLQSTILETTDGAAWRVSAATAYLGQGAINGLGFDGTRLLAVGWDGVTPGPVVWTARP